MLDDLSAEKRPLRTFMLRTVIGGFDFETMLMPWFRFLPLMRPRAVASAAA